MCPFNKILAQITTKKKKKKKRRSHFSKCHNLKTKAYISESLNVHLIYLKKKKKHLKTYGLSECLCVEVKTSNPLVFSLIFLTLSSLSLYMLDFGNLKVETLFWFNILTSKKLFNPSGEPLYPSTNHSLNAMCNNVITKLNSRTTHKT